MDNALALFKSRLRGALIARGDPDYDQARKLYNAMIDKHPLLIARCADAADVIAAVNFGRESKLPIAVRGGGHNGPGLGSVDDGLVIDLSAMRGNSRRSGETDCSGGAGLRHRRGRSRHARFRSGGSVWHRFDHWGGGASRSAAATAI